MPPPHLYPIAPFEMSDAAKWPSTALIADGKRIAPHHQVTASEEQSMQIVNLMTPDPKTIVSRDTLVEGKEHHGGRYLQARAGGG